MVALSVGHKFVGGTRGSYIGSSAADLIGMRGLGGLCEMCMCLARGEVGG